MAKITNRLFQRASIERSLRSRGIDPQTVDTEALIDPTLTLGENRRAILGKETSGEETMSEMEQRKMWEESQTRESVRRMYMPTEEEKKNASWDTAQSKAEFEVSQRKLRNEEQERRLVEDPSRSRGPVFALNEEHRKEQQLPSKLKVLGGKLKVKAEKLKEGAKKQFGEFTKGVGTEIKEYGKYKRAIRDARRKGAIEGAEQMAAAQARQTTRWNIGHAGRGYGRQHMFDVKLPPGMIQGEHTGGRLLPQKPDFQNMVSMRREPMRWKPVDGQLSARPNMLRRPLGSQLVVPKRRRR